MSKLILCIPSYQRPNGIAIERCKDLKLEKFLFIRKSEEELYSKWKDNYTLVLQKDSGADDIGKVRRNIIRFCNNRKIDWAFIFDDDIQKVETLGTRTDGTMTSQRIIDGSKIPPCFEEKALKLWYKIARKYDLSLSSPNHRAYDRRTHGQLTLNKSSIIQCILVQVPDIMSVGNYKSLRETGNEDYYIQYKLMEKGLNCGKVGLIEYDVQSIGSGSGGCNASDIEDLKERYENYIQLFKENVCDNEDLVSTKTTKTGVPSLKFVWKNWEKVIESKRINLMED